MLGHFEVESAVVEPGNDTQKENADFTCFGTEDVEHHGRAQRAANLHVPANVELLEPSFGIDLYEPDVHELLKENEEEDGLVLFCVRALLLDLGQFDEHSSR